MTAVQAGSQLGPYEILSQIGAGGMCEVYKARDTRLNRTVAVKVLPRQLSDNTELKARQLDRRHQVGAGQASGTSAPYKTDNEGAIVLFVNSWKRLQAIRRVLLILTGGCVLGMIAVVLWSPELRDRISDAVMAQIGGHAP